MPISAMWEELKRRGWSEGRNLRLDLRYGANNANRLSAYAAELVNLSPDVFVAISGGAIRALQQRTQTIPIVAIGGGDIVENGLVKNTAHPEGNITGAANIFGSMGGKWVELLKEAAPHLERGCISLQSRNHPEFIIAFIYR
jgi:ABC-type uncharacterized transport system substrate-binding protein